MMITSDFLLRQALHISIVLLKGGWKVGFDLGRGRREHFSVFVRHATIAAEQFENHRKGLSMGNPTSPHK